MALHWQLLTIGLGFMLAGCWAHAAEPMTGQQEKKVDAGPFTLVLRADKRVGRPQDAITVAVELLNSGKVAQSAYMPGIIGWVSFLEPDEPEIPKHLMPPDGLGLPYGLARPTSANRDENFVVLEPSDLYGRRHVITPQSACNVQIEFYYANETDRRNAWKGKSKIADIVVRVRSESKSAASGQR